MENFQLLKIMMRSKDRRLSKKKMDERRRIALEREDMLYKNKADKRF